MLCIFILVSINTKALAQLANVANNERNIQHHQQAPIQVIVSLIVFPPFIYQEKGDACFGNAVDELNNIFTEPQFSLILYCSSPARVYKDFTQDNADITISIKSTSTLGEDVFYSNKPYETLNIVLISRSSGKASTIAAIRGYTYQGHRQKLEDSGYKFKEFSKSSAACTAFLRGGTDSFISYEQPFEYYLNIRREREDLGKLNTTFTKTTLSKVKTYFVVNKKSEHARLMIDKINAYFNKQSI